MGRVQGREETGKSHKTRVKIKDKRGESDSLTVSPPPALLIDGVGAEPETDCWETEAQGQQPSFSEHWQYSPTDKLNKVQRRSKTEVSSIMLDRVGEPLVNSN